MQHWHVVGLCALVGMMLMAPVTAYSATISDVIRDDAIPDPTTNAGFAALVIAYGDPVLTWNPSYLAFDPADPAKVARLLSGGRPTPVPTYVGVNVPGLKFDYTGGGTGGGGGGGGGGGATSSTSQYSLENTLGGPWEMDYSILLYDPEFTGTSVTVMIGNTLTPTKTAEATATEVIDGIMLMWHIAGEANEKVYVSITANGGETYATGYFIKNQSFQVPEPASLTLLALGLAGLVLRRRK